MEEKKYSIGQLAELSGVSRRTIRFYVQSGLLAAPAGAGRGHYYTEEHLLTLQRIVTLKENNLSLEQIDARLRGHGSSEPQLPIPTTWVRIEVCPGIELHVQGGRYPVTPARLKRLHRFVQQLFGEIQDSGEAYDKLSND